MSDQSGKSSSYDPFGALTGMRDAALDAWARAMTDMVNSEAYAEGTAKVLDNYLTLSAPFREVLEETMTKTLTQLSMPTRADVIALAERLTNIELKLDDLDAKIDDVIRGPNRKRSPETKPDSSNGGVKSGSKAKR